jgi:soluble lytic murein transglycosylase-like protein
MPYKRYYISAVTNNIITKEISHYIEYYSKEYGVEKALIEAIIMQESKENPTAMRYEPHLTKAKWYLKLLTEEQKKDPFSYFSMGSMQVLFGIAKHHGFKGTPHELLNPKYSIAYGVIYLKDLIDRYYNIEDVISSYNQGSPKKYKTGKQAGQYHNQIRYVNPVLKYYKQFGGSIKVGD